MLPLNFETILAKTKMEFAALSYRDFRIFNIKYFGN